MADLMIGNTNVTKLLREKYKKLGRGWVVLLQVPIEKNMDTNIASLKILINELGYDCAYVTLSKPYPELEKLYKSRGIATEKLYFIDAISQLYGIAQKSTKKCIYTSGPLDIDSIAVSLRELLSNLSSEKKCVFLDSVTVVLLYNSLPRTIRFSQFFTEILKKIEVGGIMVSIAKGATTEKLVKELIKICDEAISISAGGGGR